MKLSRKQLTKLIKESAEAFDQRQAMIRAENDAETDAMEEANRIAHIQLKSSVMTLCEQLGEYSAVKTVVQTMLECQITLEDIAHAINLLQQRDLK